ncbi:inositol monophosphatase family protein [Actinokineospora sp. NBRC 105648]|uniref:inositol monophosphatase family protein n=1 Tax=Actinokineospora sp. NBRC 105648 TaxID=3032206 RepID=UPI0024A27F20|nr:inositol monophosphatase family protein [Actinokineospora sp. NBRC 105648]GLZ42420.1 inositol monophosphatase [Actinokineospora sp. NBRC 105648]
MNEHQAHLKIAEDAVTIARDLIANAGPLTVRDKGDRDRVTNLDITIERTVRAYLADQTPDIGFLGEEEGTTPSTGDSVWTLDPIDGTSNLVHGLPLYAVSLALVTNGRPVVAVIDLPALNMHYTATEGGGAHNQHGPITASTTTNLSSAIVSLGDYAVGPNAEKKNQHRLAVTARLAAKVERIRMFGSAAIDLAWLAEGRTDAAIILSNSPWDIAAGTLVAGEAGARIADTAGNPYWLASSSVSAAGGGVASELIAVLNRASSTEEG